MQVSYGPPGHKGVTQIMGLGAIELPEGPGLIPREKPNRITGGIALAATAFGLVTGSSTARNLGLGGLAAILYIQLLSKSPEAIPAVMPGSVQGWG
jgi:hypothetical protein